MARSHVLAPLGGARRSAAKSGKKAEDDDTHRSHHERVHSQHPPGRPPVDPPGGPEKQNAPATRARTPSRIYLASIFLSIIPSSPYMEIRNRDRVHRIPSSNENPGAASVCASCRTIHSTLPSRVSLFRLSVHRDHLSGMNETGSHAGGHHRRDAIFGAPQSNCDRAVRQYR